MASDFLNTSISLFAYYRSLAEKAIAQIGDDALYWSKDENNNSIAVIMKHLAGNMLSRWTDFLQSDGEKPWRNRDEEFIETFASRSEILAHWDQGWDTLFSALHSLTDEQLDDIVYIRNEGHTVTEAIMRQLAHYANHCGQIILLAKMLSDNWRSLSIPKNKSTDFNQQLFNKTKSKRDFTIEASRLTESDASEE